MVEFRGEAKLHRRQEAERGLELEAAQVMLISVFHTGTGVFHVGSSSIGCCTRLYWYNP